jgi:hypothetical protein
MLFVKAKIHNLRVMALIPEVVGSNVSVISTQYGRHLLQSNGIPRRIRSLPGSTLTLALGMRVGEGVGAVVHLRRSGSYCWGLVLETQMHILFEK